MEEALVATGEVTEQENKDLDAALAAFRDAPAKTGPEGDYSEYAKPLLAFIDAHPQSNWNAALHTNIGLGYYHAGYYSRAFDAFEKAWKLGRDASNPQARLVIDRAVGELAGMHSRLGHEKELNTLLADIGSRPIGGPATELMQGAREAKAMFRTHPEISYLCGPYALKNLLVTLKASRKQLKVAEDAKSGPHGFSLTQLAALADKAGVKYTLIHREPGQPVPVPSILNWNVHHYAAVTGRQDRFYTINDPTFGNRGANTVIEKTLDAESSGYFLVPAAVMAANKDAGWRTVNARSAEAKAVYGMGLAPGPQTGAFEFGGPCLPCGRSEPLNPDSYGTPQMTIANARTMTVDLNLTDTPVGYRPQIGTPALTRLTYNARDDIQPATFAFSNVGPKWGHSWQSYIVDHPDTSHPMSHVSAGGGGFVHVNSDATGLYEPEIAEDVMVVRTPASGVATSYTRTLPDGAKELYNLSNGATTYPRYMFLTKITDARGNVTTLNYDSTFRITSVVDAMGRSTAFTYGLTGYPLLITKITDPFGRASQFTYDTSARLSSITDAIGITSGFTYSTSEPSFITTLTTPYGNSTFNDTVNPNDATATGTRSLTLTDPLGNIEYLFFYQNTSEVPYSDPAATVPTGMYTNNALLYYRNTFVWNAHAATLGATFLAGVPQSEDVSKSTLYHWYHYAGSGTGSPNASNQLSSTKRPLENKVWLYNYQAYDALWSGTLDSPTAVGRVLDDGTSQVSAATYPVVGYSTVSPHPLTLTDPKGRQTKYTYATNNIDMLTMQQKTSVSGFTTIGAWGSYNTQHEPQTYTDAAGQVWHYTWNAAGQRATITDPNSGVTTFNYDTSGRLSSITNANSQTQVSYGYDSADRIRTRTDSEGYVLTYDYDALDRITKVTYPDGTTDLYDYTFQSGPNMGNPSLELRKHTDRLSRVTSWDFDADRRLTSVTEPTSGAGTRTTSYSYYEDGTLKEIADANGNVTHWAIDLESRPISKTYGYGTSSAQTETYAYENTTSRLKSITDALGQKKTFTYGLDDRITNIAYTSTVNTTPNVTLAWDTYFPRLTSMADGTGTTTYSYTAAGTNGALKLSSIAGPYTNSTIGLTYDALGRLGGRTIAGGNETFGYDALSRLTTHGTPLGSFTDTYLGQTAQQLTQSVTNGTVTVSTGWGYDTNANDRRLISIANSGVSRSYTLGYGSSPVNVYDIMSVIDTAASGHPWATQSRGYSYDNIDRLLTASATTPGNDTYAYDPLDNATTITTPSGTVTPAPTYNVLNQLSTFGSNTYSYDANGNTLSGDGLKTYKWDAENRLVEIDYVGTSNKSVFSYDGVGHRTVDAETVSGTTTTTYTLWCPDSRSLGVGSGSSICQTRNSVQTAIRRDLPEGEYNVSTSQKLIYSPDQLSSVRDVIDGTSGNLVQSYDFTPYGAVARSSGTTPTDLQYAGLSRHPQSTLNLATYRPHDGVTGRFTTRDPIKELAGSNAYAYVRANPVKYVDLLGLDLTPAIPSGLPSSLPSPLPPAAQLPVLPDPQQQSTASNGSNSCSGGSNQPKETQVADRRVPVDTCKECTAPTGGIPDPKGGLLCPDCFIKIYGPPLPGTR